MAGSVARDLILRLTDPDIYPAFQPYTPPRAVRPAASLESSFYRDAFEQRQTAREERKELRDDRPLYCCVRDAIVERIRSGVWKPGQVIPNEAQIAAEFNVSPGTARRALESLVKDRVLHRSHGAGTWVQGDTLAERYRFFSVFDKDDVRIAAESRDVKTMVARANSRERAALKLENKARVIRISRTRTRNGKPFITEKLSLPQALFPKLADDQALPDALYDHYQRAYKVLVMATKDRLDAVVADAQTAQTLGIRVGAPLLRIDRIAYAPTRQPVEWRVWLCHLKNAHYLASVE